MPDNLPWDAPTRLWNEIAALDLVEQDMRRLVAELRGREVDGESPIEPPEPVSLEELLEHGPELVRGSAEGMWQIIGEIRDMLE